jgi:hypothetical protein
VAEPDFSNNEMRKVVASLQGLAAMNGRLRGSRLRTNFIFYC